MRRGQGKFGVAAPSDRTLDGVRFDSKREMQRYAELRLMEKAGEIVELELQPKYPCEVNGRLVCTYYADFRYRDKKTGAITTEDVKSPHTRRLPVYRIKRKLVQALYRIEIVEVE